MHADPRDDETAIDCVRMTAGLPRDVMLRFGDKWSLVVLSALFHGPRRFTELHNEIVGISHRVLTTTLRSLERDGLITREEFDEVPRRVVYEMSPLGHSLRGPIVAITEWAASNQNAVHAHRESFDRGRIAARGESPADSASLGHMKVPARAPQGAHEHEGRRPARTR